MVSRHNPRSSTGGAPARTSRRTILRRNSARTVAPSAGRGTAARLRFGNSTRPSGSSVPRCPPTPTLDPRRALRARPPPSAARFVRLSSPPLYSHDVRRLSIGLATLVVAHAPATIGSDASTIRQVAVAGQAAPGGGSFEHFSIEWLPVVAPVNDRGQVAFFATLLRSAASEGIFLASGSSITKIAVDGDRAPGGGTLSGFGKHPIPALNAHGSVAFAAAVAGGTTVEGIFLSSRGRLRSVAVAGGPAPGIASGTFAVLDAPALNDRDYVAFLASVRRGREQVEAIYLLAGRALTEVVAQGDPAPAGGTFAGFCPPALNGQGTVAFAAVVEGRAAPGGVFVADTSGVRMLG